MGAFDGGGGGEFGGGAGIGEWECLWKGEGGW